MSELLLIASLLISKKRFTKRKKQINNRINDQPKGNVPVRATPVLVLIFHK